jgi:hypothetical protein
MIPQTAAPPPGTGGVQREIYCSSGFANSTRTFFETQPQLSPIPRLGYKFWVTENIGNLGKSREAVSLKRGSCTDIPHSKARDFYPKLAQVGKGVIEGEVISPTKRNC